MGDVKLVLLLLLLLVDDDDDDDDDLWRSKVVPWPIYSGGRQRTETEP